MDPSQFLMLSNVNNNTGTDIAMYWIHNWLLLYLFPFYRIIRISR